ncbi:hypothetical protein L1987_65372 [Smallanthus sonchifolius]|uniref:Uncharacterized protein n=1 Tax=Smallanthus sonchifolius TaxID=185202 RepID=A0ACB9BU55_9ASTR|nr:hypothetical protein L1987_65372 [Smallanthus sonchifolius]
MGDLVQSDGSASSEESVSSILVEPVDQSLKIKLKATRIDVECSRIVKELKDTKARVRYLKRKIKCKHSEDVEEASMAFVAYQYGISDGIRSEMCRVPDIV